MSSISSPTSLTEDALNLESFGYKQELKRDFSLFGMIGFAFSVLTCWTALAGSLVAAIEAGGPPVIIYSWIGVSFFSLFVAYSFAEICSAFPVAGKKLPCQLHSSFRFLFPQSILCGNVIDSGVATGKPIGADGK